MCNCQCLKLGYTIQFQVSFATKYQRRLLYKQNGGSWWFFSFSPSIQFITFKTNIFPKKINPLKITIISLVIKCVIFFTCSLLTKHIIELFCAFLFKYTCEHKTIILVASLSLHLDFKNRTQRVLLYKRERRRNSRAGRRAGSQKKARVCCCPSSSRHMKCISNLFKHGINVLIKIQLLQISWYDHLIFFIRYEVKTSN